MDDDFIVTAFVIIAKTMAALGQRDDVRAQASDAEVLTVAVVAARYFQNHQARALQMMRLGRCLSGAPASRASTAACTPCGTGWGWRWRRWGRALRLGRPS
jgi:hypothetical protein